ncbi:TRAP transporter small permease subunit [Limisalsivibrio acetivorans]|uniref:TRAP transporter small permease subunit n=1 Tax=Limisalsivibrio acetivorans TaxID=1304888 RepID=UPI0003B51800|nr:TRAP transporter small permease subunit [Limisalsivibrio acetivorans]
MLDKIERIYDKASDWLGYFTAALMILMTLNVFYDVIMRYFFKTGNIAFQEMEWHLFSIVFLLGIVYALKEDGHVRVDVIYDNISPQKQAVINIVGTFVFLIPFSLLIASGSIGFVKEAYVTGEISGDPGGLTHRWLIKAVVPLAFSMLALASVGYIVKNINIIRRGGEKPKEMQGGAS